VLYLHGNRIAKLPEIAKLAQLPKLTKLTLHGNPCCEARSYRWFVPAHVPALKSLDFGAFTKVERDSIDVWRRGHAKRQAAH
jgi:Leucine-rich repeat